jgi:hypothetical protein
MRSEYAGSFEDCKTFKAMIRKKLSRGWKLCLVMINLQNVNRLGKRGNYNLVPGTVRTPQQGMSKSL